ncbi:MAG: hypothetical protein JOY91_05645 [Sinobacteraceae bacterium]|nr:hypothetical protein [Nevskiaceae bacterium]
MSLKTPEKPLSPRDLNARILTHEFAVRFAAAVQHSADDIAAASTDPRVRLNALRWKIAATRASLQAAGQMAPMLALLDTWALTEQMNEYLDTGAGRALFATQQPAAVALSALLFEEATGVVQRVTGEQEFARDRQFVRDYSQLHPIDSLDFARASMVAQWTAETGAQGRLADSLGTVPEALAQTGDLLRMYGDAAPSQMLWKAQLTAEQSGISEQEVRAAFERMDERLAQLTTLARSTPQLMDAALRDLRTQFDTTWTRLLASLHEERIALAASVDVERQAALQAVDAQRVALAADASHLAQRMIGQAGEEVRHLVRQALVLVILLVLVALGLPFAAGYLVGRAHRPAARNLRQ